MKTKNIVLGTVVIVLAIIAIAVFRKPAKEIPLGSDNTSGGIAASQNNTFTGVDSEGHAVVGDGPIPATIAQAQTFRMSIKDFAYVNASDGKPVTGFVDGTDGMEVIWTNNDSMAHTVTFDNGMADSGSIAPGGTFAFFFTKPGTYAYHCTFHPNMKGSLSIK